ncbi:unnamed protein product, partial [Amoebophrya sp. A120]|eukprot:GSA120T00023811001.1
MVSSCACPAPAAALPSAEGANPNSASASSRSPQHGGNSTASLCNSTPQHEDAFSLELENENPIENSARPRKLSDKKKACLVEGNQLQKFLADILTAKQGRTPPLHRPNQTETKSAIEKIRTAFLVPSAMLKAEKENEINSVICAVDNASTSCTSTNRSTTSASSSSENEDGGRAKDSSACGSAPPARYTAAPRTPAAADSTSSEELQVKHQRSGLQSPEQLAQVYGELPFTTGEQLFGSYFACEGLLGSIFADDVFYDVGSGFGKTVLQVYLTTRVRKAVGIELGDTRHEFSVLLKDRLLRELFCPTSDIEFKQGKVGDHVLPTESGKTNTATIPPAASLHQFACRGVFFRHENMFHARMSDATIVFFSSLMFSDPAIEKMAAKILTECPNLRFFVLLSELPLSLCAAGVGRDDAGENKAETTTRCFPYWEMVSSHNLAMGWSDKTPTHSKLGLQPVYVYRPVNIARYPDNSKAAAEGSDRQKFLLQH